MRAKVEHRSFRVIKRQRGLQKVGFERLPKNTAHVITLFGRSHLWMVHKKPMAITGQGRLQAG